MMSLNPRSITDEELRKIIEEASKRPAEARYILVLQTFVSEFHPGLYYKKYEILKGQVNAIRLNSGKVALIPLTIPVIVLYKDSTPNYYSETLYVFTESGWKEVKIGTY